MERLRRSVIIIGLSFALGALIDTALTWRMHEFDAPVTADRLASNVTAPTITAGRNAPAASAVQSSQQATVGTSGIAGHEQAVSQLHNRHLDIPVDGVKPTDLRDTFFEGRFGRAHEAIDIMAPRSTPVHAVEDGTIAKLFTSAAGGLTIYQFDPSSRFCYYYAHLDRYANGMREGDRVRRGEVIGYVGSTGNASEHAPHLHFAIFRLTPTKQWWKGDPINPYPVLRP